MTAAASNWPGMPVTIVGLGRSAVGAARLLAREGARPFVTDISDAPSLAPWRETLEREAIPYEIGGHTARAWDTPALVVLSPGVPPSIAPMEALRERGIEVIGELELASRFAGAPLLAVTGTNGKTTVTELLRHILTACGFRICLAGNNHTSFSAAICDAQTPDYYVLEVSSYQLEMASTFRPWIGAVLNVTPDHLGRHGTMEAYAAIKSRIFGRAGRAASWAVLHGDDPAVRELATPPESARRHFSALSAQPAGIHLEGDRLWVDGEAWGEVASPLPGPHNRENIAAALTILHAGGFDLGTCAAALADFPGVEHRLEPLGESGGHRWFNDSKSTNVDSLRVALESFEAPLTLIAGGQGKGSSYDGLKPLARKRVAHLIAYGAEGPVLAASFGGTVPVTVVAGMGEAVRAAREVSPKGGTVLLSPGCASFDQYTDFEARGAHFKALVAALNHEESLR